MLPSEIPRQEASVGQQSPVGQQSSVGQQVARLGPVGVPGGPGEGRSEGRHTSHPSAELRAARAYRHVRTHRDERMEYWNVQE